MRDSNLCKIRIGAEKHGLAIQPRDHLAVAVQPYFDHRKPIHKMFHVEHERELSFVL